MFIVVHDRLFNISVSYIVPGTRQQMQIVKRALAANPAGARGCRGNEAA